MKSEANSEDRFSKYLPKRKVGMLLPLPIVENVAYEFYQIVRDDVILVLSPGSISEFSLSNIEQVIAAFDADIERLVERGVDMIIQAGVPLATLIGLEEHDRMVAHIAKRSGKPSTSQIQNILNAANHLGIRKIAFANKWSPEMNDVLGQFFSRVGISAVGVSSNVLQPSEFTKLSSRDSMTLAYQLGRQALDGYPDADGIYLGGGTWLSEPIAVALEKEFQKPVITNTQATIWDVLKRLDYWTPFTDHGWLLASK